jgi:hypothetical protein
MLLLRLFQFIAIALAIAFVVTQIAIPLFTSTLVFPMFRKPRKELLAELNEVQAQLDDQDLSEKVVSLKAELAKRQAAQKKTEV